MTSRWRRRLRRWRHGWTRPKLHVVSAPAYSHKWPVSAIDGRRADRILAWIDQLGLVGVRNLHVARYAPLRQLARVHGADYLDALQEPGATLPILGTRLEDSDQDLFLQSQRAMVGGTILASRLALRHGVPAFNLGGGLHHASADKGQGFCAFNDVAVAISLLRRDRWHQPVLVIDLDLHDGEGTRSIFASDTTVHTLSIHNRHLDPSDALESTSIELGDDVTDAVYLNTVRRTVTPLLERFRPGLVFYLAGADPAGADALGNWRLTDATLFRRDREVLAWTAERKIPTVVLPAGGYGKSAWRIPAHSIASIALGNRAPVPPESLELDLRRYRRVASMLRVQELTVDPDDRWELSESDLTPGVPTRQRFLDFYSAHGIELALERYGILKSLKNRGYPEVRIALDLSAGEGDTVRLFPADVPDAPLFELSARRDARLIPGREFLYVEWMLMQDPARDFTPERPSLPGQAHPGLGMLGKSVALLILVCERLGLDGLAFTPRSYHVAAQSSGQFHFLELDEEVRFRALRRLLGKTTLAEAARLLERGAVVDRDGIPVQWKPSVMILPVSEELIRDYSDPVREKRIRELNLVYEIQTPR